jgi:hypothetical protein
MLEADSALQAVTVSGIALLAVLAVASPAAAASATVDGPVTVQNASDQRITGTTSLDAGANVTVRVQSTGDTQPRFLRTRTVEAGANGNFSAAFDFSNQSVGDAFEVTVVADGETLAEADGEVVEASESTEKKGVELPGFGVASALAAGVLAAGAALRRL